MSAESSRQAIDQGRKSPGLMVADVLHALLAAVPLVCFIGALLTDLAYLASAELQWSNFSSWLITAGLVVGVPSTVAGIAAAFLGRHASSFRSGLAHGLVGLAAYVIELFNVLVHSRDGWTAVAGTGVALSAIGALLMLLATALGVLPMRRDEQGRT